MKGTLMKSSTKGGYVLYALIALFIAVFIGCSSTINEPVNTSNKSRNYLLKNKMEAGDIDAIQIVIVRGSDHKDGFSSKIITDTDEISKIIYALNNATVGDRVELSPPGSTTYACYFFSDDLVAHQFKTDNYSDDIGYIRYPDATLYELYCESMAKVVIVDNDLYVQYPEVTLTEVYKRVRTPVPEPELLIPGLKIPNSALAKGMTEQPPQGIEGWAGLVKPTNYDLQLAIDKGLCGEDGFGEKYLYMQALYRKVFERWFLESTSLREFNDRLADSDLNFGAVPEKWQSFYQYYSTMDLPFVYLCSNIPIERLEEKDLALLRKSIENLNADVTPELTDMVKRTFSDTMMAKPNLDDDMPCGYGYGWDPTPNRSIVLEISNYNYDENGDFRDYENNAKRRDYMKKLAEEMQQTLSEQIGHRVIVKVD